jgi:hypothetical protein
MVLEDKRRSKNTTGDRLLRIRNKGIGSVDDVIPIRAFPKGGWPYCALDMYCESASGANDLTLGSLLCRREQNDRANGNESVTLQVFSNPGGYPRRGEREGTRERESESEPCRYENPFLSKR